MSVTSAKTGSTSLSLALENNFMEPIASVLVGAGGANTIAFTDIPQGYKHLQMRGSIQTTRVTYGRDWVYFRLNGDRGANYSWHKLDGDGTTIGAGGTADADAGVVAEVGTSTGGTFGVAILDILDYSNTNKYKTVKTLGGGDHNGAVAGFYGTVTFVSGSWRSFDPVSSLYLHPSNGPLFAQYSRFSLYGIKG